VGVTAPAEGSTHAARRYRHDPILIGLRWSVEAINRRINQRVRAMFYPERADPALVAALNITESLPAEVRRLHEAGLLGDQAIQAIGYKQIMDHIRDGTDLDDAFERTKIATRRFARQQRTWMRRFVGVAWIDAGVDGTGPVLDEALSHVSAY
jgi:tRNA dimethylallyltransferase